MREDRRSLPAKLTLKMLTTEEQRLFFVAFFLMSQNLLKDEHVKLWSVLAIMHIALLDALGRECPMPPLTTRFRSKKLDKL